MDGLARLGGNVAGFTAFETSMGLKWLELLKEASPRLTHVSLLLDAKTAPHVESFLRSIQAAASSLGIATQPARVQNTAEMEPAIEQTGKPVPV